MKKRLLSLLISFVLIISAFPVVSSAAQLKGQLGFATTDTALNPGNMMAVCYLSSTPTDEVLFVAAYYLADGTLVSMVSDTVTDKKLHRLTLTIPDTVSFGDYAKVFAFNKRTLEPVTPTTIISRELICSKAIIKDVATTYTGMNERYYTIESAEGSITASGAELSVSDTPSPFRLKDMSEGMVAFEDYETPRYRLTYNAENGIMLKNYVVGDSSQQWIMEEYNDGYSIAISEGNFLAVENGELVISHDEYSWELNLKGETPFTIMTGFDGFKSMTASQKKRVTEICTSVGAEVFPAMDSSGRSFLDELESKFVSIYLNQDKLTAEEEKAQILEAVSQPIMGSLVSYSPVPTFPGGDATITQKDPEKTKHEMWDLVEENGVIYSASDAHPYTGAPINCYRIDVTYTTENTTQNVAVYCVDPNFANVQTAISALGKFPYAYRQHIENMYVYLSGNTSTFNCGGKELFVRLTGISDESGMIQGFAHELGHSNDYMANGDIDNRASHWSQGAKWTEAVSDDIATISTYGNSNSDEGFAEFARLYWLSYGNRDLQIGVKQLYPNRFASFQRMLTKIGCEEDVIY